MSKTVTWEYKEATITVKNRDANLNDFGRQGWELVQLLPAGGRSWGAVFKREVIIREGVE